MEGEEGRGRIGMAYEETCHDSILNLYVLRQDYLLRMFVDSGIYANHWKIIKYTTRLGTIRLYPKLHYRQTGPATRAPAVLYPRSSSKSFRGC